MNLINKNSQTKKNYTINSLEIYNLTLKLRKENGWSPDKIFRYMNDMCIITSIDSIKGWIYRNKKPFLIKIIKQISYNSKDLTTEKAYVIGTICGDGYISTEYRIGLSVCDKDFADYFKYCLEKVYEVKCSTSERTRKQTPFCDAPKKQHVISLVSKLVVEDLQSYLKSFKTRDWKIPIQIVNSKKEIQASFIKGFSDSEGSVRLRRGQGEISLHSTNKEGLIQIQSVLAGTFNIKSSLVFRESSYYINIGNYDSLKKFHDEIGFIIKRKQDALKQVLETYKRKGLRGYPEEYKSLAMQLLKQSLKHRQVAKLLGTNHTNIYDWEKKSQPRRTISVPLGTERAV